MGFVTLPAPWAERDMPIIPATTPSTQPVSWQQQWREAVSDPRALLLRLRLGHLVERLGTTLEPRFAMRVPESFVARMRPGDPHDPLLRQVLPLDLEAQRVEGYAADAVGDMASRQAHGVLHKYRGRVLLVTTGSCAIHCRYCFRQHFPYAEEAATAERWQPALDYLAAHPDVHELILSGGDPWSLATAKLASLTDALRSIPHVRRLRVHTRLPIALPARVDDALCDWIRNLPVRLVVVVHANHAQEIDAEVAAALRRLADLGVPLLNQSVLLRGVNDCAERLAALSERLFEVGVLPYYLHMLDRVAGAAHFEVGERQARDLHEQLRARLPGYLLPRLVREVAGAPAKTPVGFGHEPLDEAVECIEQ